MLNPESKNVLPLIQKSLDLDSNEFQMLINHNKFITFLPGDIILQQGKKEAGMYIIINGTALVSAKILGEGGTYIATVGSGNFVGEIGLIEETPCATTVIASSKIDCLLISHAYFDMITQIFPETKYKMIRAISIEVSNRLKEMHKKITSFISHSGMTTRSVFGEVIKSLTKPIPISFAEAHINKDELEKSHLFAAFTKEELDLMLQYAELIKAPKHCTLIEEGVKNTPFYLLLRGAVQSSIIQDNKIAKLSVLGPMSIICNSSSIHAPSPAIINFMTCENAILLKIEEARLDLVQQHNKNLWYKIFDLICKSLVILERAADKLDVRLNSELYNR